MSHEITHPSQSPFDAARRTDGQGSEYWSARDLQQLMGYAQWKNFEVPIERAMKAAANQDMQVDDHFARSRKVSGARGPAQADYHLTRFAAYLVAMNGDPNMPQVAAAQAYFAVRTREAEVAPSKPVLPQDYEEALAALLAEVRERKALESKIAHDAPKLAAYDDFLNGSGVYQIGTAANLLGIKNRTFWKWLHESKLLIPKGTRRNQPYANPKTRSWFEVKTYPMDRTNGHASCTTYITAYGLDQIRQRLIAEGLIESQLFALPSPRNAA